jgi:hypothetical protein
MKIDGQNNNNKNRWALEISIKSGKYSTSSLSLVIYHRVRFFKNAQKCTLALKGAETHKTINFDGS